MPSEAEVALAVARRNFTRLPREEQFVLAALVARSRERELLLAYENLARVAHGYRTRGGDTGGVGAQLVRKPCVVFVVARKWNKSRRVDHPQHLPRELLTPWKIDGQAALCAVPTDVRSLAYYGEVRPMASSVPRPFGVLVRRPAHVDETGAVTCLVRRPNTPNSIYALSCRHLFSRSLRDSGFVAPPLAVCTATGQAVATTTRIMGELQAEPFLSLDAQLAELAQQDGLGDAMRGITFDADQPVALPHDPLGNTAYIATPRARPGGGRLLVRVRPVDVITDADVPYRLGKGQPVMVRHRKLIVAEADEALRDGDSGSPVLQTAKGGRLLGMFIAASTTNKAYYIPAWDMLDPARYGLVEPPWVLA